MEKLLFWLIFKKSWINKDLFEDINFRVFIFAKYEFCTYFACIYLRECRLKENFACIKFCEIDQNSRKYVHAKNSTVKVRHHPLKREPKRNIAFQVHLSEYLE